MQELGVNVFIGNVVYVLASKHHKICLNPISVASVVIKIPKGEWNLMILEFPLLDMIFVT
mgnify:FL=1